MLKKIRSNFIIQKIFYHINQKSYLHLIKFNYRLQRRLNKSIEDYKIYNQIEIELILNNRLKLKNIFVNVEENNKNFIHIYINKDTLSDKNFFTKFETIKNIKIVLDMEITSLKSLFKDCICIEEIKFI